MVTVQIFHFFLLMFSTKMSVIRFLIFKMVVRIVNREDTDQTTFQELYNLGLP